MHESKTALDYLKDRYVGDDKKRLAALEQEFVNAEVARQIYNLRRRHGLSQAQLAKLVGTTQSAVSRLEDADYGGRTVSLLQKIAAALGEKVTISFTGGKDTIMPPQCEGPNEIDELTKLCPASEMRKRDWLPSWQTLEELRDSIRAFLGPGPKLAMARFRTSKPDKADRAALICWLNKLEIEAERVDVSRFSGQRLKRDMAELVHLSTRDDGPAKAVQWLEDRGVRCIFIRLLPRTYLDGAAMLLDDGKPAIGMTLRYDRIDYYWFTLLHEIGHILLHRKELVSAPIVDEEIDKSTDEREAQADGFARNAWVKPNDWREFRRSTGNYPRAVDIGEFAARLGVTPALVAGRLQRELRRYTHYKRFLGEGTIRAGIEKDHPLF